MKKIFLALLSLIISSPIINLPTSLAAPAEEVDFIVVTDDNILAGFNRDSPGTPVFLVGIAGLEPDEMIEAIDFIPGSNRVLAVTNRGIIREIDIITGVARSIGSISSSLVGQSQGFDFDPVTKILRLINESGQNTQVDPNTGTIEDIDPAPVYAPGQPNAGEKLNIIGLAYNNNNADATATKLFAFDKGKKNLVTTDSAVADNWSVIGAFRVAGFTVEVENDNLSFDIAPGANTALMATKLVNDPLPKLFHINLQTGSAVEIGSIGLNKNITGMAVITNFTDSSLNTSRKLPLGGENTAKVTVLSNSQPVVNAPVNFRVFEGPNTGQTGTANTNAQGEANFVYRSNGQKGIDSIIATGTADGKNFLSLGTTEWTDGPIIVSVEVTGKNLTIRGFNFTRDDEVEINGQMVNKTKFKNTFKLVAKNGRNRLFVCSPGEQPKTNTVTVFHNPLGTPAPPIQDTSAFATCP
ncbi:MAG: DUF4394 domain-containing protein [Acidobacteriota bacterium]